MRSLLPVLALLLLTPGCASTWHPHSFLPAPLEVPVGIEGEASAQASVLLTVQGIRRADREAGTPTQVELLLQLENLGETAARLDLEQLSLVTSDLVAFGAARVDPPRVEPLARDERVLFAVSFPLPPGKQLDDLDLRGLHLRWVVEFGDRRVTTGVTFDRRERAWVYGPYYSPFYY
jgi:hypothetical protein